MRKSGILVLAMLMGTTLGMAAPATHAETISNINKGARSHGGESNIVYALKLAGRDRWSDARRQIPRGGETVEQKAFAWMEYKSGAPGVDFDDIAGFLLAEGRRVLLDIADRPPVELDEYIPRFQARLFTK